jgi:post-segregation antitoxin (ccd killing protein)
MKTKNNKMDRYLNLRIDEQLSADMDEVRQLGVNWSVKVRNYIKEEIAKEKEKQLAQ